MRKNRKSPPPSTTARRRGLFKLLAVISPVVLLLGLEAALRLVNYGYNSDFFVQTEIGGRRHWIGNREFGRRFFPKALARSPGSFAFPVQKDAGTRRIFVLGESAALGDPQPAFGFSRMLERLLAAQSPSNRVEVINLAMTAINSHVILPIARECAEREGDLWVVYMGNNEAVGPFGAGTVFNKQTPPIWMVRGNLWFKTTKVGQLVDGLAQKWGRKPEYWQGMELMAQQRVPRTDPRMTNLYGNFERNLRDILGAAKAPVILCTVAVNKKDCPPFASVDGFAEECFRKGEFQKAVDEDALRFRADSVINEIIRKSEINHREHRAHRGGEVRLLDVDRQFGDAGMEMFYEHVHLTPSGNYRLARMVAEEAAAVFGLQGTNWLARGECEAAIGLSDWDRSRGLRIIMDRMSLPPFVGTLGLTNRLAAMQAEVERLARTPYMTQAQEVLKAVAKYPDDWQLRQNAGVLLSIAGDLKGAERELNAAMKLAPHVMEPYYSLAGVLVFQKRPFEAVELYKKCLGFGPANFDVLARLGVVELEARRFEDAIVHLRAALKAKPDTVGARLRLGQALLQTGAKSEALEQWREVLKLEPKNAEAKELLRRAGG